MELISLVNIAIIVQLFVILSPLSSFPVLMNAYKQKMNVTRIAYLSVLIAFLIAVVALYSSSFMFTLFGISVDSFRIAGGIVLLLLGLNTMKPHKDDHHNHKTEGVNAFVSIIATPLLTGPATISFIAIKAFETGQISTLLNVSIAFALVGVTFIIFAHLVNKINIQLMDIASRFLGLFLTAFAIEMIGKGILAFVVG
jgi:multiple antibiotic resistance protein